MNAACSHPHNICFFVIAVVIRRDPNVIQRIRVFVVVAVASFFLAFWYVGDAPFVAAAAVIIVQVVVASVINVVAVMHSEPEKSLHTLESSDYPLVSGNYVNLVCRIGFDGCCGE